MRPLPEARAPFGPTVRPVESCSALVVSHHLDGLLRIGPAGLLRPAAGLWGSSRFPAQPGHLSVSGNPAFRSPRRGYSLRRVPLVSSRFCIAASFCLPVVSVRPRVSNLPGCPGGLPSEEERRGVETSHWPKPEGFLSVRKKPKLPACAGRSQHPPSTEVDGFEGVPRATTEVTVRLAKAEAPAGASGGDGRHPPRWREAHWTGNGRLRHFNRGGLDTVHRSGKWSRRTGSWGCWMLRSAEADPHIQEVVQERGGAGPAHRSGLVRTLLRAGVPGASRVARCQVPRSAALRGSGRLQGLAPLTSPLRYPAVSSEASPVSPMGLCPLRGPLVSAAVPPESPHRGEWVRGGADLRAEARKPLQGSRLAPVAWRSEARSNTSPRVVRGSRGIPSRVSRIAPSLDCSRHWFRRAAPGSLSGSESREPHLRRGSLLAGGVPSARVPPT